MPKCLKQLKLVLLGTYIVPIFCFAQLSSTEDIDTKISVAIENIYANLYFNDHKGTLEALDKQIGIASDKNRWHLALYGLTLKAKCSYQHNIITAILPILEAAERVAKLKYAELEVLDSTYLVRSEIFYVKGLYHYSLGNFSGAIRNFEQII